MVKDKAERQKAAAGRTRGNFVSVYRLMTLSEMIDMYNGAGGDQDGIKCLVQVIDENAACANIQEAKAEAAAKGITGTLLASRRCGNPWQRVEQIVMKDVELKNVEGFNEVHVEPKTETEEEVDND